MLLASLPAAAARANEIKLTYTGNTFNDFFSGGSLPQDVYTSTDRVTGTIELLAPLPTNLVGGFVTPLSFSFSDGVNTITNADPTLAATTSFQFWTDGSGQIVHWALNLSDLNPGDFARGIQTLNMPIIPDCGNCQVDAGTSTQCAPGVDCLDAVGVHLDPLYFQVARVDGLPGVWTSEEITSFSFRGFFSPVDNDPVVNKAKAGAAVPVKFSLGGDQGLNIFQGGYPASQPVACDNFATLSPIDETVSAGQSGLTYDASADQYIYAWKTQKSWANTCRQLVIRFADGTFHIANFKF
jgi:hypothetical protein